MDALSTVLKSIRLEGAVYFHGEFTMPWSFHAPAAAVMAPGASHVIHYHLLISGRARVEIDGGPAIDLEAGDIVMLPHGHAHWMWNGSRTNPLNPPRDFRELVDRGLDVVRHGGGGEPTSFICGFMSCDSRVCELLLGGVPGLIKVSIRGDEAGRWLEGSLRFLVQEAGARRPGSEAVLAKLSETLFAEALRRYLADSTTGQSGWLAAFRDAEVGKALALLHERPAHPWTLAELAQQAGASRSVLAERFQQHLGEAPIAYLTRWRLQLGAEKLRHSRASVAEVAHEVGYESESAFNRAFKRAFSMPPARYRKQKQQAGA